MSNAPSNHRLAAVGPARPAARRVGGIIWRGGGQDASSGRFTASNERVLQRPLQAHRAFLRLGTLPI